MKTDPHCEHVRRLVIRSRTNLVRQLEKIDDIEWQTSLLESIVEGFRLAERSGKAVKDEPPAIIEPFPDDAQGKLVREKLSLDDPAFGFGAELASARLFFAQDCTGRGRWNSECCREEGSLRAFSRGGRTQENDAGSSCPTAAWQRRWSAGDHQNTQSSVDEDQSFIEDLPVGLRVARPRILPLRRKPS